MASKAQDPRLLRGFTFLEILVVLTLVVLLMGMAVPQFFALFSKPHESEYKHLKSVLKILRNDAVLKSTSYCLLFDLKTQQMMTTEEEDSGNCSTEFLQNPKILKPHFFPENLRLREAKLAETNYNSSGAAADLLKVHINSSGFVTPFFLLFSLPDSSMSWQIESKGIMGKLELREP
ncbi:MAG TPA: prepilin-type N-terminal cleavage/methylation domain-containing protein [Candidatus Lambdaproteobacteria bacterium]|nr:prepilin-type N-terminal cleavage/methylation domain-containing protein [Candidatus Lambdaproteobacteria bacterium]HIB45734.1 prepilin-type N-terminal cleavage/methylation domain-containing protein [Candidatus Lambdaproteobacteria bacterium]HIO83437.1 prepilin-type N-terminal cleavage/methylation domain-containing protein [Deltaproteobacteria bacterium]